MSRYRTLRVKLWRELFAPDAVTLREIDRLATWALCCATRKKRLLVDRELMAQAIDSEQSPPSSSS